MFTRLCLISLLILFTQRSFSCVCTKKWPYENYDYIALVEVIELRKSIVLEVLSDLYVADPDRPFPPPPHLRPFFEVVVETKTQYKGIEKKSSWFQEIVTILQYHWVATFQFMKEISG